MEYHIGNLAFDSDYLEHYGVLGMKWGVRRYQNPDGSLTDEGKARRTNNRAKNVVENIKRNINSRKEQIDSKKREKEKDYDPEYLSAHSSKPIEKMSTKELQAINNRLNQERLYKMYTSRTMNGRRIVNNLIASGLSEPSKREFREAGLERVIDILTLLAIWAR